MGLGAAEPSLRAVAAVALVSASTLGYELLLLRLLPLRLWGPAASTAISLALLGLGAAGSVVAMRGTGADPSPRSPPWGAAAALALAAPLCYAGAERIPLNPLEIMWQPWQWGAFAAVYLVLSVPFFLAGLFLARAYQVFGRHAPRVYRADLAGAAAGVAGVLLLLHGLPPGAALRVVAVLAAVAAPLAAPTGRAAAAALAAAAAGAALPPAWIEPALSPYKPLARALRVPDARVVSDRWTPVGRLTEVASPRSPLRQAPGLGLACPAEVPGRSGMYLDGDLLGPVPEPGEPRGFARCLPAALPYRLVPGARVLVLEAGPGERAAAALALGAREVTAVEVLPVAGLSEPGVRWVRSSPRLFLARTGRTYDVIDVAAPGPFRPAGWDPHVLTVEGLALALERLSPGGVLAVNTGLDVPPRRSVRAFATAVAALERRGVADPGAHLAWVRSWGATVVLVSPGPLSPRRLDAVRAFCRRNGFDLAWLPGMDPAEANQNHRLARPWLHEAARALLGPERDAFLRAYPFDVRPATDHRPFFARTFRWRSLPEWWKARRVGGAGLVEWTPLFQAATLAVAFSAGLALVLLPAARHSLPERPATLFVYFSAAGAGFMACEIALLGLAGRLLGHPLYGAALVLVAVLAAAAWGAGLAGRWGLGPRPAAGLAAFGTAAAALGAGVLLSMAEGGPALARVVAAALLAALPGAALGMPLPAGLGHLAARAPGAVPWAWGANAFASVWGAALAGLLAPHLGYPGLLALAAGFYGASALTAAARASP